MRPRTSAMLAAAIVLLFAVPGMPAQTTEPDPLAGWPEGSTLLDDGSIAVPMRADPPEWLSQDILDNAYAAGQEGMAYDFEEGTEVPLAAGMVYIRPGGLMWSPSLCTMSFIYGDSSDLFISTAGHCTGVGDSVFMAFAPSIIAFVGTTTESSLGIGEDYALVDITPSMEPFVDSNSPVGGPEALYCGGASLSNPVPVKHYGHGAGVGSAGGSPRVGVSFFMDSPFATPRAFYMDSVAAPGDSGSPVLTSAEPGFPLGRAVGILTHLIVFGPELQVVAGTRVCLNPFTETLVPGDVNPLPPP